MRTWGHEKKWRTWTSMKYHGHCQVSATLRFPIKLTQCLVPEIHHSNPTALHISQKIYLTRLEINDFIFSPLRDPARTKIRAPRSHSTVTHTTHYNWDFQASRNKRRMEERYTTTSCHHQTLLLPSQDY